MNLKPVTIALSACLLLFICLTANVALAQDKADMLKNSTPQQRAEVQTAMMKTKLLLDTIEVPKVYAINLTYAQKMEPLLKGDGGSKLAMFKAFREMDKAKDKDLKGVLTADQYRQYEAYKEEMKEKMKERMQASKS